MKQIKPFLKWPGGKKKLYKTLETYFPKSFQNYIEPFVGGGAVLFCLSPNKAIIADNNKNLIEVYETIKEEVDNLVIELNSFTNTETEFYNVRSFVPETRLKRAARLLYLNKTCFNGIYRENSKGLFNVPYGHYKNINFDTENYQTVSVYLNSKNVQIFCSDWKETLKFAKANDFVFMDPPYFPVKKNVSFTKYNKNSLNGTELDLLFSEFERLTELGSYVMMTNSYCEEVLKVFEKYNIIEIESSWLVAADKDSRKKKKNEVIITNY